MKFRLGPITDSREARPHAGWHRVPVLGPGLIGAATVGVAVAMVLVVDSFWRIHLGGSRSDLAGFVSACLVMLLLHECLHACVLPGFPKSDRIWMGLWPARGFFVVYDGAMSRERWMIAAVLPLVVLTGVPVALAAGWGIQSRFWADVSTWNAAAACRDIVYFLLVLAEVPRGATILNRGAEASWRA